MKDRRNEPVERAWDDARLAEAYRALAAQPAPHDLPNAAMAAVRAEAQSRRSRRLSWAKLSLPRAVVAGSALGLGLAAILVAGLVLRSAPAAGPATGAVPTTVDGLKVVTVSQALAAGPNTGDGLVAIAGWIEPMPVHSCAPPEPSAGALEDACTSDEILLTETRQELVVFASLDGGNSITANPPTAPYLYAHELAGANVDSLLPDTGDPNTAANYVPVRAVIVGHFHDARAADCSTDRRSACDAAFVVDQLAWLDGKTLGQAVWVGGDSTGVELKPRLMAGSVVGALGPSLGPSDTIVSMAAVQLQDITTITGPGLQASGNGADVLWYVRVAGPAPSFPPMAWGADDSGWLVLDDATGRIRGAGGWGFVSDNGGSFPPSPRPSLSGGLYALPTSNYLAGYICVGVGLDAVLHGSPTDPRVAWLESRLGAVRREEVTWPAGYRARFDPKLEILDQNGSVVLREGDAVTGTCGKGKNGVYLEPPFN